MFNEIKIAHAEYQVYNARFNTLRESEGDTVQVPNIIDRIAAALRNAASGRLTQKPRAKTARQTMATAK